LLLFADFCKDYSHALQKYNMQGAGVKPWAGAC